MEYVIIIAAALGIGVLVGRYLGATLAIKLIDEHYAQEDAIAARREADRHEGAIYRRVYIKDGLAALDDHVDDHRHQDPTDGATVGWVIYKAGRPIGVVGAGE